LYLNTEFVSNVNDMLRRLMRFIIESIYARIRVGATLLSLLDRLRLSMGVDLKCSLVSVCLPCY